MVATGVGKSPSFDTSAYSRGPISLSLTFRFSPSFYRSISHSPQLPTPLLPRTHTCVPFSTSGIFIKLHVIVNKGSQHKSQDQSNKRCKSCGGTSRHGELNPKALGVVHPYTCRLGKSIKILPHSFQNDQKHPEEYVNLLVFGSKHCSEQLHNL